MLLMAWTGEAARSITRAGGIDQGVHGGDRLAGGGCSSGATATKERACPRSTSTRRPPPTPEQFVAGLTDFGPGRSKLFGRSADDYLEVHDQGPDHADVTEGSGGIWERLHYDWSDPNRVVMTTTDSNTWGGDSGHTYTFTRQPNGTTDVDVVVVRDGKNVKGRLLGILLGIVGKRVLGKELGKTVKAIEARNEPARASEPT